MRRSRGREGDGRAVRKIVAEILNQRVIDDDSDHARVQLARLASGLVPDGGAKTKGDLFQEIKIDRGALPSPTG